MSRQWRRRYRPATQGRALDLWQRPGANPRLDYGGPSERNAVVSGPDCREPSVANRGVRSQSWRADCRRRCSGTHRRNEFRPATEFQSAADAGAGKRAEAGGAPMNTAAALLALTDMQSVLAPAGEQGGNIARLWWIFFWVLTAVFALVSLLVFLALFRRRRAGNEDVALPNE